MTIGAEVLQMLIPQGGWAISGDEYQGIEFIECEPITEEQFNAGFAQVDTWKAQAEAERVNKKAAAEAKLAVLGLTADDLKALGLA